MDASAAALDRRMRLREACPTPAVEAVYLFGSRADEGVGVPPVFSRAA